jgi:hypothetical protein
MDKRGVFRVNYYESGQPKTALVVATTDTEAGTFLGVTNVPGVQITRDRYPVEVAGLDPSHPEVLAPPIDRAPFDLPKSVSRADFAALQVKVDELTAQINLKNTPASPQPPQPKE